MATDFESEGLLDGLEGAARQGRLDLLTRLEDDGVELSELKAAVEEGRLALLPVERVLTGSSKRYTPEEVSEQSDVEMPFLERYWRAIGLAIGDPAEAAYTDDDVEAANRLGALRAAGMSDDSIIELARVMSRGLSPVSVTMAGLFAESFVEDGDDERTAAERLAEASGELLPTLAPALEYTLLAQTRALVRQASVLGAALTEGVQPEGQPTAIAFADLVDFTKLGEGVEASELGAVANRLEELARDVADAPVRLVKTIGDEVMLESSDTDQLLQALLDLVDAADREGDGFPQLSAGMARGEALARGGDLFGHPVNLASRVTATARPGSVLVTEEVKDAVDEDDYSFSFAGERKLKGVKGGQKLFRVRRAGGDDD